MVLVATQVKRRRGTTAENDAFTGAEGEITVDTEKHELRVHDGVTQGGFKIGGGSGSGRNIGDMFMTKRTDTALAGAVECNGGTYNTEDYEGEGSIGELLEAGKLDYISLTAYATAISTKGWCNKIGWDGTGTTSFRVPTITPRHYIVKVQEPTAENNYTWYRLYADGFVEQGGNKDNDVQYQNTITLPIAMADTKYSLNVHPMVSNPDASDTTSMNRNGGRNFNRMAKILSTTQFVYKFENSITQVGSCWTVSGQSAITPESANRVMFQLFNGTTDEAVATVGTVVAQVGENTTQIANRVIKGHEVIAFQAPTAQNNYTWYRKYADNWVEQGGFIPANAGTTAIVTTLPVEMADGNYTVLGSVMESYTGTSSGGFNFYDRTTTSFKTNKNNSNRNLMWHISGMSAQ